MKYLVFTKILHSINWVGPITINGMFSVVSLCVLTFFTICKSKYAKHDLGNCFKCIQEPEIWVELMTTISALEFLEKAVIQIDFCISQ